jgi:hypothetical protein
MNASTTTTLTEYELERKYTHYNMTSHYKQNLCITSPGFELSFSLLGSTFYGAQSHDYCEDESFFSFYLSSFLLKKHGIEQPLSEQEQNVIHNILNSIVIIKDDTRLNEDDPAFTGLIKITYALSALSKKTLEVDEFLKHF